VYPVQEWIEGETLSDRIQASGQFSDRQVRDLLTSLLPVLEFVHSQKILHRDIKPDNIIFRQKDGQPVLIDFGAVKETMNTVMTSSGGSTPSIAIGTPGFMPAEQAAGRPVYSSDLYALGMTGIFLLTGKMPQEMETDSRTGQLLWRSFAPQVTPNLALVLDRAIRFNPGDRYYDATEMLKALQPVGPANAASDIATVAVAPRNPYAQTPPTTTTTSSEQSKTLWLPIAIGGVMIFSAAFAASIAIVQNSKAPSTVNSSSSTISSNPPVTNNNSSNNSRELENTTSSRGDSKGDQSSTKPTTTPAPIYSPTPQPSNSQSRPETQPETQPEPQAEFPNNPPIFEETPASESPNNPPIDDQTQPETQPDSQPDSQPEPQPDNQPDNPNNPAIFEETNPSDNSQELPRSERNQPPSKTVAKPSRTQAIRDYYANINQRQYSSTWNQLTSDFRQQQSGSYQDYQSWWNSVQNVNISKVTVLESNEDTALVDTQLTYVMKDGRVSPENLEIWLIWDEQSQQWLIDKTQRY
jgi:serine/threonine-protein kinase